MKNKIVLVYLIFIAVTSGILIFEGSIIGSENNSSEVDVTIEKVSLDSYPKDSVAESFVEIESKNSNKAVIVGRIVSSSGTTDGIKSDIEKANGTIKIYTRFDKPNKSFGGSVAHVVNIQEYRVTLENTEDYNNVIINGREFEI